MIKKGFKMILIKFKHDNKIITIKTHRYGENKTSICTNLWRYGKKRTYKIDKVNIISIKGV